MMSQYGFQLWEEPFFRTVREILNAKGKILLGKCSRLKIAIDVDTYDI